MFLKDIDLPDNILSKIKQDNINIEKNIEKKQVKLKDLFPINIEKINKNYYSKIQQ